jgi:hypothetical protein
MVTVKRLREEVDFENDEAIQYAVKKNMLERVMDKYPLPELEETFDDDADDDDADDDDSEKQLVVMNTDILSIHEQIIKDM